jgi:Flp pilus assembly protein TadG
MGRARPRWAPHWRGNRGQSMVEVAIALPVVLLILLAVVQFGKLGYHYLQLTDAVRAAGRAAMTCRFGGDAVAKGNDAFGGGTKPTWSAPAPGCPGIASGTTVTVRADLPDENLLFGLGTVHVSSQTKVVVE